MKKSIAYIQQLRNDFPFLEEGVNKESFIKKTLDSYASKNYVSIFEYSESYPEYNEVCLKDTIGVTNG